MQTTTNLTMIEHDNPDNPNNEASGNPTFTLFNQLPIEIRLHIWEAALPGPRVIDMIERRVKRKADLTFDPPFLRGAQENVLALWSHSKAPSTLSACRESHSVASKVLIPSFAFASSIPEIYFNFQIDTLYLRDDTFVFDDTKEFMDLIEEIESIYDVDHIRQVQNLAILLDPEEVGAYHYHLGELLGWFGNIQKLTIVVGHFDRENGDNGDILFIEAIDVIKTCHHYEMFSQKPTQLYETLEASLPVNFVSKTELERSLEEKRQRNRRFNQELKDEGVEEGVDLGDIPMPDIEYKSSVTAGLKSYLDILREGYQQKLMKGQEPYS